MAPVVPNPDRIHAFATANDLGAWLRDNHDSEPELWLRIYKNASGVRSVNWAEAVSVGLCWGWIDGIKKSFDEKSYLQRFSPRKKDSLWSMVNRRDAERLIASGQMQPPGFEAVEAAKANGRWDHAYLGAAEMEIPADFLRELKTRPKAQAMYDGLDRANLYAVYFQLQTALKPQVRANRMQKILDTLEAGKTLV